MARATEGDIVRVICVGRMADGREFQMSPDGEPIELIVGHGDLLPDLERAVIGMAPGESRVVVLPQDKGYGPHREELVQVVDRDLFPKGIEPKVGQRLRLPSDECEVLQVTIAKVTETEITVDANHPLAGQDVLCKITLLEIVEL
jgi:peptidylprolyl isomerase